MGIFLSLLFPLTVAACIVQFLRFRALEKLVALEHPDVWQILGCKESDDAFVRALRITWVLPMPSVRRLLPPNVSRELALHAIFNFYCIGYTLALAYYFTTIHKG